MIREKFTKPVSEFYNKYFFNGEHEICYLNFKDDPSLVSDSIMLKQHEIFLRGKLFSDIRSISNFFANNDDYDYIVLHSYLLFNSLKLFLFLNKTILRKTVWIAWGADLYQWHADGRSPLKKLLNIFVNFLEKNLRTNCDSMVAIFPPDIDFYRKEFPRSKIKIYYAPYCGASIPDEYLHYSEHSMLSNTLANNETVYIQIGHSATSQLNHISVLDSLYKFSDKNIRILMPLSYGDKSYADKVQAYAEEKFPGKVVCLREILSSDDYFDLINRVDIAIFNTQRQIALGNVNRMIFRNVKIYMPYGSVMYDYFVSNGVPIQKYEDINCDEFTNFIQEVKPVNKELFEELIKRMSNMETQFDLWRNIYDDLRERLKC